MEASFLEPLRATMSCIAPASFAPAAAAGAGGNIRYESKSYNSGVAECHTHDASARLSGRSARRTRHKTLCNCLLGRYGPPSLGNGTNLAYKRKILGIFREPPALTSGQRIIAIPGSFFRPIQSK